MLPEGNTRRLSLAAVVLLGFAFAQPDPGAMKIQGPDTTGNPVPVAVVPAGGPGSLATAIRGSASSANTTNTATLTAVAAKTTYITGFVCTAGGSTAGLDVNVTLTGIVGGTATFSFNFPTGVLVGATPLVVTFNPPFPASAANTNITVVLPAGGAGNTNASVVAFGFNQ